MTQKNIITFIIPTISRETLKKSILSLFNQTSPNWRAIIVFDAIDIPKEINEFINNSEHNDNFLLVKTPGKLGENTNNAGRVRNFGIEKSLEEEGDWIGFLDDDDIIDKRYVEDFFREINENRICECDVFIYRMNKKGRIIPGIRCNEIEMGDVGISFIVKKSLFKSGIRFYSSGVEDFLLLNQIRKLGYKIFVSSHIYYYVNNSIQDSSVKGNEIFINYNNEINTYIAYGFLSLLLLKK